MVEQRTENPCVGGSIPPRGTIQYYNVMKKLKGANMGIAMKVSDKSVDWEQDKCPWNEAENTEEHKCAVESVSICKYFQGVEKLDTVQCSYVDKK